MIIVYTIEPELDSAKKLGFKTIAHLTKPLSHYNNHTVVRWGNSWKMRDEASGTRVDFRKVLNPADSIAANCLKHRSLAKLAGVVPTAPIFELTVPAGKVAVVRPIEHCGGSGFTIKEGPFTIPRGHYATEFVSTPKEFRVWFAGDKTMCGRRIPVETDEFDAAAVEAALADRFPCRSKWGYTHFEATFPLLHRLTLEAAKTLKLQLGAADVLWDGSRYYFLELNSAPTLDSRKAVAFYQENIERMAAGLDDDEEGE